MRTWSKRLGRDEAGQALVELALVIPLLLFIVFAIVDFGLAINSQNADTNLANLAAREVAVIGTSSTATCGSTAETTLTAWVKCEATATAPSIGVPTTVCVGDTATSTTSPSSVYAAGDPIRVTITVPFNWLGIITGGVGSVHGISGLTTGIAESATLRLESSAAGSTFLGTTPC